ncbi:cation:proton antiporter domain-containing protein [Porphyromonas loveana]|uniref:cation:proton antiporter domain-containing protein n=1 Tax=Porphyromonas loveana TaxID=1884669 RepID=UPI0035A09B24
MSDLFDFHLKLPITDPTWVFFLVLSIILFAPLILSKLRIPHIVGMILAGIAIGEHGLNLLMYDSSFKLFGKVGIYYIMFLAGLEMNMSDFKQQRGKALVLGLLAFILPMCMGLASNIFILEYGLITSILLASMYASHTLITYPIVIRYGISRQRSVSIAVGGTAVTDTLTLLVLAVISGLYKGESSEGFWIWLIVKIVILGAIIIYTFPRICRWFFRRYNDGVVQYVFVMSMLFLGAGLMELVGMEGILGAFLVGLVLNRLIPHVSPLMNHLEFVGNALFIPYFLIGVGMIIDIHILFGGGSAMKVAGVMTVMALFSKWVACWITQKIYRMSVTERELMYGLSNAQAAATLAAVLVGYNIIMPDGQRLLNEDVLNGTIVLILFTCIISSFITERAARKMAMELETQPEEHADKGKENILIPVKNPETIEELVGLSLLIRNVKQRDRLIALSVMENDSDESGRERSRSRRNLELSAKVAAAANVDLTTVSRYDLNVASGIIHTVKEQDATSIIIGLHHKTNIVDSFFGSLTENLLKGTNREVMIAKFLMPLNTLRRIIVAVPPKAEYEPGFAKWVAHFCRMAGILTCRIHFFASEETLARLRPLIEKRHSSTLTEFSILQDWDDLLLLTGEVNFDHLLVIISARRGSISHDGSFDRLPNQLSKYFANNSLIVLYPDQFGDPQEVLSFSDPRGHHEAQPYKEVGKRFYKWFKKN